jgi:putative membrane protein
VVDPRFTLANERTYLAWVRTAIALVAGGLVAAKAVDFHHEALRWVVTAPLLAGGALLAAGAPRRWRATEAHLVDGTPLPALPAWLGQGLAVYALVVAAAVALD